MIKNCIRPQYRGFTLLEVLVAVLVLSVGLLGLAGLQTIGLRNNQSAYYRSLATQMAYDMADRMRGNPWGVLNGNYNVGVTASAARTNVLCDSGGSACTPADMAHYDFAKWSDQLALLPSGTGVVCADSSPDDGTPDSPACAALPGCSPAPCAVVHTIKVWWDDNRSGSANQRLVMSFQP